MSSFRYLLLLAAVAACAFSIGMGAHRIEAGAYSHLGALFTSDREVRDFLARQYVSDAVAVPLDKNIDTALLPLDVTGLRLSDYLPVPKIGGAIVAINNELLIVDRLGNIYACGKSGEVRKLAFPPLPNGIDDYLRAGNTVNSQVFRAYSIKYLSERKLLVVSHEMFDTKERTTRLAVSTIGIDAATLQPTGQWSTIFSTEPEPVPPNDASGGRLAVSPSGKIYLSVGVYNIEDRTLAQDPHSSFGKILEIDPESKASRVVSVGHRNPQGLMVSAGGELWSTDHGPAGGDALNLVTEGSNSGWPDVTLGTNYGSYRWNDHGIVGSYDGYRPPVFAWVPSIAASNLIEVKGFDQRWDGDFLVSSLKGQSLYRLRLDKDRVVYSEPIWIGQRLRDIAELADGTIALWTDDAEVLFLSKDQQRLASNERLPKALDDRLASSCMFCHHLGHTKVGDAAPSLTDLFSRKIGSDTYRYSASLRNKDGIWTEATLKQFLSNPNAFASGTSMPPPNLSAEDVERLVAVLKNLSTTN